MDAMFFFSATLRFNFKVDVNSPVSVEKSRGKMVNLTEATIKQLIFECK